MSDFPTALTNAVDGVPGVGTPIAAKHLNNLETKVGITGSADTNSLDHRVAALEAAHAFPVNSVYINISGTNPATELGYGTWAAIATGQMLIGVDSGQADLNAAGKTGGARTKNIAHTHSTPELSHGSSGSLADWSITNADHGYNNHAAGTTGSGASTTQDVTNPFYCVYIWKRTA